MSNFSKALEIILHHEGGYVNHPKDPGGETNLGVTKRVYEDFGGTKDMKELTQADVEPIYKKNYWDKCKCDDLPSGLDYVAFDWAVNSGVNRSSKGIQKSCGAEPDGIIGLKTLELVKGQNITFMIENFQLIRQEFYERLDHFDTFGKGWTRRNNEATKVALEMVKK